MGYNYEYGYIHKNVMDKFHLGDIILEDGDEIELFSDGIKGISGSIFVSDKWVYGKVKEDFKRYSGNDDFFMEQEYYLVTDNDEILLCDNMRIRIRSERVS